MSGVLGPPFQLSDQEAGVLSTLPEVDPSVGPSSRIIEKGERGSNSDSLHPFGSLLQFLQSKRNVLLPQLRAPAAALLAVAATTTA